MGDLWDRYNFAYRELFAARRKLNKGIPPYTAYHRTAGEVEARNAQKRKRMSAEEKRQSLLSETEDVAEESKIYLFEGNGRQGAFSVDGKYFKKWQDVLEQFKKDLEGIELNQEQKDVYDVVLQQKDKIRLRINDLNELEDIFVNFGTRKKGIKKLISIHYAGLRNPVTALEVLNIGDVIRRGKITEEGTKEHPTSRRYELRADDGYMLKVIIDFYKNNEKNRSVINFYSDRPSDTGAHYVSSSGITDLMGNIPQNSENSSDGTENNGELRTGTDLNGGNGIRFSVAPAVDTAYLEAVENGDMETAQRMVEEAAAKSGYSSDDSWRMNHRAPNSQDVKKDPDGPTQKITDWRKIVPRDYFDHPEYYIDMSNPADRESFYNIKRMLGYYEQHKAAGDGKEKNVVIRLYRAVAKDVNSKEDGFRNGDWVTPSRIHAELEGELNSGSYSGIRGFGLYSRYGNHPREGKRCKIDRLQYGWQTS